MRHETPAELARANARAASARESARRNRAAREGKPGPDLGAAVERLRVWLDDRDAHHAPASTCQSDETPHTG